MPEEMTTEAAQIRYDDFVKAEHGGWLRVEWTRRFGDRVQLKAVGRPPAWLSPADEVQVRR